MFGVGRRAVCCLLGLAGAMGFAGSARADTVNIAPDLECGIGSRSTIAEIPCVDLEAGMWFTENTHRYNVLLQFDIAGNVPRGAKVESATLHLNRDSSEFDSPTGELSVFEMLAPWTDQDTWESLGGSIEFGDDNPGASDVPEDTTSVANGDNAWDVTDLVAEWSAGETPNNGLAVADVEDFPSSGRNLFYDSSAGTSGLRPRLEVEYDLFQCPSDPFAAAQSSAASTVYAWNGVLLDLMREGGPPTTLSRAAAMMHVGIFDTFNSVFFAKLEDLASGDPDANQTCGWESYLTLAETPANTNANLAAEIAARDILLGVFPGLSSDINTAFTMRNGTGPHQTAAEDLGEFVADEILAERLSDGSGASPSYTLGGVPGAWRPSLTMSPEVDCVDEENAVSPGWGNVTPFTLSSGSQFRQPLPGGFNTYAALLASSFYAAQVNEVKVKGRFDATGTGRTQDQEDAAFFWANDLDGTYKPPGQLLQHTYELAMTQPAAQATGDPEDFFPQWSQQGIRVARLFAEVSLAMADSAIAAWDQKYLTPIDLWRPAEAIQEADTDGRNDTQPDENWLPLSQDDDGNYFSPCFPAWVSGHATFGGTWGRVMENEFRHANFTNPFPLELTSEDPNAIDNNATEREFDSFAEAAEENAESRIWLGVHYRVDAEDGLATGRAVADHVAAGAVRAQQTCEDWDCTVPIP